MQPDRAAAPRINPDLKFCPRCAAGLEWRAVEYPGVLHPVCATCGFILWQNVKPCADALILRGEGRDLEVLLGRQGGGGAKGLWDTPGGFLNAGDRIESALVRECRREMDIEVAVGELLGAFEQMFIGIPIVVLFYVCRIALSGQGVASGEPRAADIIDAVGWFPLRELPPIAYPAVEQALAVLQHRTAG